MAYRLLTAAAVFCLLGGAADAQSFSIIDGPNGGYLTTPLGGGMSVTNGPNGFTAVTTPLGGGMSTTTVTGGHTGGVLALPGAPPIRRIGQ